jgi:hypothetical protein
MDSCPLLSDYGRLLFILVRDVSRLYYKNISSLMHCHLFDEFMSARQGKDQYGSYTAWVCSTWRIADTVDSGRSTTREMSVLSELRQKAMIIDFQVEIMLQISPVLY